MQDGTINGIIYKVELLDEADLLKRTLQEGYASISVRKRDNSMVRGTFISNLFNTQGDEDLLVLPPDFLDCKADVQLIKNVVNGLIAQFIDNNIHGK